MGVDIDRMLGQIEEIQRVKENKSCLYILWSFVAAILYPPIWWVSLIFTTFKYWQWFVVEEFHVCFTPTITQFMGGYLCLGLLYCFVMDVDKYTIKDASQTATKKTQKILFIKLAMVWITCGVGWIFYAWIFPLLK